MAPLRSRNFRWYFLSRAVNLAGTTMAPVALAFGVLGVSSSAGALGAVLAARMIAVVALLLLGGVLADRFSRRLLIQGANVLSGLTQAAIAVLLLTDSAQLWHLVALSAVNGIASAASMPALAGIMPQLVPADQLQEANALNEFTRAGLLIIGPSVSAGLVITIGPGWALLIDAVTWLIAAAMLTQVRLPAPAARRGSMLAELRLGWDYFRRTTWLWLTVVILGILNTVEEGGFKILGPVRAIETDLGESGWGLILSAQALGAFVATIVLMRRRIERPLVAGMIGVAVFGLPMLVMGLWPTLPAMLVAAVVSGMGIVTYSLAWHVAMQENVPEEMLSRAYSYDQLGSFAAIPIGQLSVGPLVEVFGAETVLVTAGLAFIVLALLPLLNREVRGVARVSPATSPSTS